MGSKRDADRGGHLGGHGAWFVLEMPVGESKERPTQHRQPVLSSAVAVERFEVEVVLLAVRLDGDERAWIGEIEEGRATPMLHPPLQFRPGQGVPVHDLEEEILERRRTKQPSPPFVDEIPHDCDAVAALDCTRLEPSLEDVEVDLIPTAGLVDRAAQRDRVQHRPEIDQGSRQVSDWDCVDHDRVATVVGERFVDDVAGLVLAAPAATRQLDEITREPTLSMESSRAAMRRHRARRSGQDAGEQTLLPRGWMRRDPVDTLGQLFDHPCRGQSTDRRPLQAKCAQLLRGDEPVVGDSLCRDAREGWSWFMAAILSSLAIDVEKCLRSRVLTP